jgi:hypothetical protein
MARRSAILDEPIVAEWALAPYAGALSSARLAAWQGSDAAQSGSIIPNPGPPPTVTPLSEPRELPNDISNQYAIASDEIVYVVDPGYPLALIVQFGGSGAPFTNNGTIWLDNDGPHGYLLNEGRHDIVNHGLIHIRAAEGPVELTNGINSTNSLTNYGSMFFIAEAGQATAFNAPDYWAYVENHGLIAVQALGGASSTGLDVDGVAIGLDIDNTVAFTNHAGARLLVEGSDLAIGVYTNAANDLGRPIVDNAGLIEAQATGPDGVSVGIYVVQPGFVPNTIVNSGTIRADIAIYARNTNRNLLNTQEFVRNLAGGVIDGHIDLGIGDDELANDGFIIGDVVLDAGNDIYRGSGSISGVVDLGFGNDRFTSGAWNDRVIGGRGDDVINSGGGDDILVGGFGNDILDGFVGNDTLIGEWGNDTIITGGGDYVEGNDGNDRVELGDYTFQAVHGGAGTDTLVLATDTRDIDLGAVLASGRVTGFEIIHLNAFKRLLIDAATALDFIGKGVPLRIIGYDTDAVLLEGVWTLQGSTSLDGVTYNRWLNGAAEVLITPSVAVQMANGQDFGGLDPIAAGTPAQQLGAAAGIDYSSPATLLLSHVVQGEGFTVDANEIFFSDGRDVFFANTATTLTNNGLIESYTTAFSAGVGIEFGGNATVINNGVIDVQQLVPQDYENDIFYYVTIGINSGGGNIDGDAPLQNNGEIFVYSRAGSAIGLNTPVAVINTGLLAVISEDHRAIGVNATYGSHVTNFTQLFVNTGTIYVEAGGFGRQIAIENDLFIPEIFVASGVGSYGSLTNDGDIIAVLADDADQTLQTVGVYVNTFFNNAANPATVTNNGLIVGTTAITFRDQAGTQLPNHVINNGLLVGDVVFLDSNDVYDGTRGQIEGTVFGNGGNDILRGGAFADRFDGGLGNDTLDGGSNVDTAVVRGSRSAYTVTQTSTGVWQVTGADGTDTLTAIEFLQFDDQILRLRPGTGVSVNFNTADPSVYQASMNLIRDFDGNALGGNGSWLRIGSADVNGDGDVDQILVNRAIGRFATVGTAPDGLTYFSDHGWAGETRVAGIYIDPLVQSGQVVAGSANDSQRRFQNDLQIENINRVLGANDYDNDGVWEVYFALTDGTAYLRALMHADGNIRYANYQSQQEVIDYLTANGFGSSTWGSWFPNGGTSGQASFAAQGPDNTIGRTALRDLGGENGAMPGDLALSQHAGFALLQPDAITAEFYG